MSSMDKLLTLPWHDAELTEIVIDRSAAGMRDTVQLGVIWPDRSKSCIEFYECYGLEANMNFGIVARETVRELRLQPDHPKLHLIRTMFPKGSWFDDLTCVVLEMNSTASKITIFASQIRITAHV